MTGHARSIQTPTWTWILSMDRAQDRGRGLTRDRVQRHRLRLTEERREHLRQQGREARRVRCLQESDLRRSHHL